MTTDRSTASDQKETRGIDGCLAELPTAVAEPDYDDGLVDEHGFQSCLRSAPGGWTERAVGLASVPELPED